MGTSWRRIGFLMTFLVALGSFWCPPVAGESPKISPALANTLDLMSRAGAARETMGSYDLEQFSNPLVRVDQGGRVQVEIYLDQLDAAALRELQATGVTVELTSAQHRIVQGWVPFYLVEDVAQVANVKRIIPPDYAVSRGRR